MTNDEYETLITQLKVYLEGQRWRGEPRSVTAKTEAVIALVERDRRE